MKRKKKSGTNIKEQMKDRLEENWISCIEITVEISSH